MYRDYLKRDAARDLAKQQVLLIRDQPLPPDTSGLIDNQLVGTAKIDMRGSPIQAYAYIQRPKRPCRANLGSLATSGSKLNKEDGRSATPWMPAGTSQPFDLVNK